MLDKDSIKEIYKNILLNKNPRVCPDDIVMKYLRLFLPKQKDVTILDAGCGNGRYVFQLVKEGYKNVYAVDLFEDIPTDNKFIYKQASIDNLPFSDSFFDFIYCLSVIFYLPDPEQGIKEFKRVLKKNGVVFITAHTKYSLFTLWRCIKRYFNHSSVQHLKGVKFYTAKQYCTWLERNDFRILLVDGYNLSFFIYPLYRKFVHFCDKFLNIKLPLYKGSITRSKLMAKLKSIFGYHSIIVAKKK